MSGEDTNRPVHGTASGDAYVALPPTAVDAVGSGPTRLVVAWPGFDPPRTAAALAAAIPMTGVPVWRVYLDLPGRSPGGLGSGAILETESIEAYCAAVQTAVDRLPATLEEIRDDLGIPDGPVALAGFSAGAATALLAVARGTVPVSAAALVAPVVAPSRAARAVEKRSGRDRAWSAHATELADRLDLGALAATIAERNVPTLLISGGKDRVVPPREITALRDELRRHGAASVEAATFRMGHALAAEPGTEPRPPITEAVRVDGVLTDWFRDHLAQDTPPEESSRSEPAPAGNPRSGTPSPLETAPEPARPEPARSQATPSETRPESAPTEWSETPRAESPWSETAHDEPALGDTQPVDPRHGSWAPGAQDTPGPRPEAGVGFRF